MITTAMHPATVHKLVPPPAVVHKSRSLAEDTVISVAAVRRTSNIAARARDAREIFSVSRVSFGAELGRPPVFRHQVSRIDRAGKLLVPEFFVSLSLLQPA